MGTSATPSLQDPASNGSVITIDQTANAVSPPSRLIQVSGAGSLNVTMEGGQTLILTVVDGQVLPIRVTSVDGADSDVTSVAVFW